MLLRLICQCLYSLFRFQSIGNPVQNLNNNVCSHVDDQLKGVIVIFGEVDRAARRLEQLTEQRRERLREVTRQKALQDEMKMVCR